MPEKAANPSVPVSRFDCRDFPPAERLSAFRRLTRSVYEVQAVGASSSFEAEAIGFQVGEVVFNRLRCSPAHFHRREKHLRGEGRDFLVLEAQLSGGQTVRMGQRQVRMLPGHLYLRDWALPFESAADAMTMTSVIIPRHRLEASAAMHARTPVVSWQGSEPAGRALWLIWERLMIDLAVVPLATAKTLTEGFLGFLDGLLGYGNDPNPPATLDAIEQFLAVRLRSRISAQEICERFRLSRSTLYRIFAPHGGLQRFIVKARLEHCFAELVRADPTRVCVGDVAAAWGFGEAAAFTRAFRRQYGLPPSKVLGQSFKPAPLIREAGDVLPGRPLADYMAWLDEAAGGGLRGPGD